MVGGLSWVHWLIVAVVVMLLFGGRGKISSLMGDFAQGIKAFKKGMAEDDKPAEKVDPAKNIDHQAAAGAAPKAEADRRTEGARS